MGKSPEAWDELRAVLQSQLEGWAPGQRRIARVVLDDPQGTAFRSVAETARMADVHPSSVVRFAGSLGLRGYPGLVALCRQQLTEEAHLVQRFDQAAVQAESGDLLASTLAHEHHNLHQTLARIDPVTWGSATHALAEANRVHVMGLRKCLPVAQLLAYLLRMVRPAVHQIAPIAGALTDDLRDLGAEDVFVAISIERYTAETVAAFEAAKERGLRTIALTDSPVSPLAHTADITLLAECEGVTVLRSVAGLVVLAQSLATAVAVQNGQQSRDQLLTDDHLLEQFHVYRT